jgi:hypothetical protein
MGTTVSRQRRKPGCRRVVTNSRCPLVSATEVLEVDARAEHAAVDDPGRQRPESTAKGACHGLVEQTHPRRDLAQLGQRKAFECASQRLEVGASVIPGDGMRVARALENGVPVGGDLSPHRLRDRKERLREDIRHLPELALGLGEPARGNCALVSRPVVEREHQRHGRGGNGVARTQMRLVRTPPAFERVFVPVRPHACVGEPLEINRAERLRRVRRVEELECRLPVMRLVSRPPFLQHRPVLPATSRGRLQLG